MIQSLLHVLLVVGVMRQGTLGLLLGLRDMVQSVAWA